MIGDQYDDPYSRCDYSPIGGPDFNLLFQTQFKQQQARALDGSVTITDEPKKAITTNHLIHEKFILWYVHNNNTTYKQFDLAELEILNNWTFPFLQYICHILEMYNHGEHKDIKTGLEQK